MSDDVMQCKLIIQYNDVQLYMSALLFSSHKCWMVLRSIMRYVMIKIVMKVMRLDYRVEMLTEFSRCGRCLLLSVITNVVVEFTVSRC